MLWAVPHPSSLSRRALLAGVPLALVATTTACEADRTPDGAEAPRDPDEGLLSRVTASTWELDAQVAAARAQSRPGRTATALDGVSACLAAHLSELDPDQASRPATTPGDASTSPAPDAEAEPQDAGVLARSALLAARTHVTLLDDCTEQAESGAFARLLASAAAGLEQHLVALERRAAPEKQENDR